MIKYKHMKFGGIFWKLSRVLVMSLLVSFAIASSTVWAAPVGDSGATFELQYKLAKEQGCNAFRKPIISGVNGQITGYEDGDKKSCESAISRGDKSNGKKIENAQQWLLTKCAAYANIDSSRGNITTRTESSKKCLEEGKRQGFLANNTVDAQDQIKQGSQIGSKDQIETGNDDGSMDSETECAVQYFGWIVCPGTRIGTGLVIGFYGVIANNLLDIKSKDLFMTQGGGDQQAAFEYWKIFRDIANVTLAIIISIVVFSQVTNLGLSNYGLKKMLPRLIMFAIIINISFWLVAAFVDFSNIVGSQIFKFLGESGNWELEGEITKSVDEILRGKAQTESGESWTKAFGAVAGVTAITVAGGTVLAILFAAMVAIFLMFVILTARQAAVIMLVVVSPIAFASAILPNTDGFYNKWKSFLKTMLMIYPICSIMVGGLVLASNVLYKTAVADKNVLFQIVYGLLPMIGLFGTYAVIKGVLSLIDKITGGTGTLSGAFKGLEKFSMGIAKNNALVRGADNFSGGMKLGASRGLNKIMTSDFMKGRSGRFGKISARGALAAMYYSGARSKIAEESHKRSREIMDEDRQIQYLQGLGSSRTPDQNRELARLESARAKRKNEINEAAAHFLAREAKSGQELIDAVEDAINSGNSDKAIQAYMAAQSDSRVTGGMKAELNNKIAQMISPNQAKAGGSMNEFMTQVLSNYGGDIKKTDAGTHKSFTELINGNHALGDLKPANITNAIANKLYSEVFSKMSSEQLAEQGNFEVLEKARDNMSATEKAAFQTQIDALAANDKLRSEIGGDKLAILDRMRTPPPAAPQPLTAEQKVAMEGQARLESQIKMFNQQLSDGKISRAQFEDKVRIATAISNNEALIKLETIAQQKAEELRNLADQATREGRHADATKHLSEAHSFEAEAARYKGIDRFDES